MARVLISGASVAGPVLAFWLRRAGVDVTVVEKAPTVRGGGYPIDLRGVAVDVVERMGLLERVEAARTGTRALTFVTERGREIASLGTATLLGEQSIRAVELPRGDLTRVLWEATRDDVEYVFDDRITALDDRGDGVHVTFRRGEPRVFDLVVGADGLHSGVRALTFGPEAPFRRDLDACYAAFSVPNVYGLEREAVMMNLPGRSATLYAVRDQPVTALLSFSGPIPTLDHRDTEGQRRLVAHVFGGVGWWVPEMLVRMRDAEDFYFDTVSQNPHGVVDPRPGRARRGRGVRALVPVRAGDEHRDGRRLRARRRDRGPPRRPPRRVGGLRGPDAGVRDAEPGPGHVRRLHHLARHRAPAPLPQRPAAVPAAVGAPRRAVPGWSHRPGRHCADAARRAAGHRPGLSRPPRAPDRPGAGAALRSPTGHGSGRSARASR